LHSADELLMTEMIFNGMFNNLTVPQCVALISCFVCDEKSNEMQTIGEELSGPLRQMQVSKCLYVRLELIVFKGGVTRYNLSCDVSSLFTCLSSAIRLASEWLTRPHFTPCGCFAA
jgi:superfamily II RNA helicase